MPNYNKAGYIQSAIRSVLNQTMSEFELVVVDDASTDSSVPIIESMSRIDSRIKLVVHRRNKGTSSALNTGIGLSLGKILTFMGSDDLFAPRRAERIVEILHGGALSAVVYSDPVYVDEGVTTVTASASTKANRPSGMILKDLLCGRFGFIAGPIAAPQSCFQCVGGFDEMLNWGEDFEMSLRLSERFPFFFDSFSTYGYRIFPGNILSRISKVDRWSQQGRILEKYLRRNFDTLDSKSQRASLSYLFSCYVATRNWPRIFSMGFKNPTGLMVMLYLPYRAASKRIK